MKTFFGVVLGIFTGALLMVGITAYMFTHLMPKSLSEPISANIGETTSPLNEKSPVNSFPYTSAIPQVTTSTPGPSLPSPSILSRVETATPVTKSASVEENQIHFRLNVTQFTLSGPTTGAVTIEITNIGKTTAHKTWAKVEIYSQNDLVKVNDRSYYTKEIGTIESFRTITTQGALTVNPVDAFKIMQYGANVTLTLYAEETTQTATYNFHP